MVILYPYDHDDSGDGDDNVDGYDACDVDGDDGCSDGDHNDN